jgi:hypothetical protein
MPGTSVRPRRLTFVSTELATNVRRTYGYQGYCACGWEGKTRGTHGAARADAQAHRREAHEA